MPRRAKPASAGSAATVSDLENLLAGAAQGDRETFVEIYDRMAPRILGVIKRILDDAAASEQVLEDVFAELWRESRSMAGSGVSVAAWLTFRARSAALDRSAKQARQGSRRRESSRDLCGMLAWLPDAEAIRRIEQRRPLLAKVLSQLPREQLEALDLVVFGGRAEDQVADQLQQPLAKVKAELRATSRFLRHRRHAVVGSWAVNI